MANRSPTDIGDVLILWTSATYTVYAVGRVVTAGQSDFGNGQPADHVGTFAEASKAAKAIVAPRGRIHLLNIDTGEWSEVAR